LLPRGAASIIATMKQQSVVRGAAIMMIATAASRVLGYVKEKAIAYQFGSTSHTDAFWAAFQVPDLLYYLLAGGALGAALIPVVTGYLVQEQADEVWRVVNTLATLMVLAVGVGVALIIVFAPYLVPVAAYGFKFKPHVFEECVFYVRIMAPMVFFTTLSALAGGILQSHHHFTAPAAAWLMYNVGIIAGALLLASSLGIVGLCIGVLAGAALMVAVQAPALARRGWRFRPALELSHPGVRRTLILFFPLMAGLAVQQIALLWLPGFFGSFFRNGVTILHYANRLIILPLGLFGVSISTAAFPTLAQQFRSGQSDQFKRTLNLSLRAILLLSVPCSVGLMVLSGPIISLLWQGGAYNQGAARASAFALTLWAPALFAIAALQVVNRGFYSTQDTLTPPLVGVANVALIVGLTFALKPTPVAYGALALATSIATVPTLAVSLLLLRRKVGPMDLRTLAISFARVAAASSVMGAVSLWVSNTTGAMFGSPHFGFTLVAPATEGAAGGAGFAVWQAGVQVVAAIGLGAVAFLVVLRVLGAPELGLVSDTIRRRLARRGMTGASPGA